MLIDKWDVLHSISTLGICIGIGVLASNSNKNFYAELNHTNQAVVQQEQHALRAPVRLYEPLSGVTADVLADVTTLYAVTCPKGIQFRQQSGYTKEVWTCYNDSSVKGVLNTEEVGYVEF